MKVRVTHFMRRAGESAFSIERLYEDVRRALPAAFEVRVWICPNFSKGFWPRLRNAWSARGAQADVNHVTGDVHYVVLFLDPRRTILTIHDLAMLGRLRGIRRAVLWFFWFWLPVRWSRFVIVISEATRTALLEEVGCDPSKIRLVHNTIADEFGRSDRPFDSECPRILQVGTGANKNLPRLAAALEGCRCKLIVIGRLSREQTEALARHRIVYENRFGLSLQELVREYELADLLAFVSTEEGFGLPIVEAQAVGRPVVTSAVSSMPEVAGGAACLVDPFDVASIRAGIERVIDSEDYRNRLVLAGLENAERFRSAAVAARYAELYREVIGSR